MECENKISHFLFNLLFCDFHFNLYINVNIFYVHHLHFYRYWNFDYISLIHLNEKLIEFSALLKIFIGFLLLTMSWKSLVFYFSWSRKGQVSTTSKWMSYLNFFSFTNNSITISFHFSSINFNYEFF